MPEIVMHGRIDVESNEPSATFLSFVIAVAERVLSPCVTRVGSLATPVESRGVVLPHSLALLIHEGKSVLSFRIPLVGSFEIPGESLGIVLRHCLSLVIHIGEFVLSAGVSLLGSEPTRSGIFSEFLLAGSCLYKVPSNYGDTD